MGVGGSGDGEEAEWGGAGASTRGKVHLVGLGRGCWGAIGFVAVDEEEALEDMGGRLVASKEACVSIPGEEDDEDADKSGRRLGLCVRGGSRREMKS